MTDSTLTLPVCDNDPQRTVIAQIASAVFGGPNSVGFYYILAATALILILAANTAFNGLPMLGSILASQAQSEEVKKISAWAAILFAPTLIGTVYGMNFEQIPELRWAAGYPLALAMMLTTSVVLYGVFRWRGWL